jgi:hypothetical protein
MSDTYTTGDMVKILNVPLHRVRYFIHTRNVKPIKKLGPANVYDITALAQVKQALAEADARNGK